MNTQVPVDVDRAHVQWEVLRNTYLSLGHRSSSSSPWRASPTWCSPPTVDSSSASAPTARSSAFLSEAPRASRTATGSASAGIDVIEPAQINEGEGDFLALRTMILAGTGFRTSLEAHIEAANALDRPVVSLELVDPRFYHLDTAIAILDDGNGDAPPTSRTSRARSAATASARCVTCSRNAIICREADALVLGLNSVSDGHNVIVPSAARRFAEQLRERGYTPVPVDLSEFLKSGGSVKCCTMEMHPHLPVDAR